MKKNKLLFLTIIIILFCTGCTIKYDITISKDNIDELITVNDIITETRTTKDILDHYEMWYPVFVNYIPKGETIELEDFSEKVDGIKYYEKNIKPINNGYEYTYKYKYDLDEYYDSYALATAFVETTVQETRDTLVLKSSKENLLCNYENIDSLEVNITIDPKVYKLNYTNTTNIQNNTYKWKLDKSNCNNSQILLTLNKINSEKEDDEEKPTDPQVNNKNSLSDYTLYIFAGIAIVLILIGNHIFKKMKSKNENFNEED